MDAVTEARYKQTIAMNQSQIAVLRSQLAAAKAELKARDAWTREGFTVIGCALAARAARQLESDSGIPSATLDALLREVCQYDRSRLHSSTVIVVDEAAMVGTRKLNQLLFYANDFEANRSG